VIPRSSFHLRFPGPRGPGSRADEQPDDLFAALTDALTALAATQRADGSWPGPGQSGGETHSAACECASMAFALGDVGQTAIVTLAFLADGSTAPHGCNWPIVARALGWLREQQDDETHWIDERAKEGWIYDHLLATTVLGEAYYSTRNPVLSVGCYLPALQALTAARKAGRGWGVQTEASDASSLITSAWACAAHQLPRELDLRLEESELDVGTMRELLKWSYLAQEVPEGSFSRNSASLWIQTSLGGSLSTPALDVVIEKLRSSSGELSGTLECELGGALLAGLASYRGLDRWLWESWRDAYRSRLAERAPVESDPGPHEIRRLAVKALCLTLLLR